MAVRKSCEIQRDLLTGMAYHRGTTLVTQRTYSYDTLGRPLTRSTARNGQTVNDSFVHNSRSELASAMVNGASYGYDYDNIGNRRMAMEANDYTLYEANALNQYTSIQENEYAAFAPTFDDDGNQTLVRTSTGIWSVQYNAENHPIRFTSADGSTVIECSYDTHGRRATKKTTSNGSVTFHQRYIYRGYLQIACCDLTRSGHPCLWLLTWDPTQPIATRPLAIRKDGTWYAYGCDLTKNICEVFGPAGYLRTAYTYSPYGEVSASGDVIQPIQWSSEYYDTELGLVYYNYRHYNATDGRWIGRDMEEDMHNALYAYANNFPAILFDYLGLQSCQLDENIKKNNETIDNIREDTPFVLRKIGDFTGFWDALKDFNSNPNNHTNCPKEKTEIILQNSDLIIDVISNEIYLDALVVSISSGRAIPNPRCAVKQTKQCALKFSYRIRRILVGKRKFGDIFKGRTPEEIEKMFKKKHFTPKGIEPAGDKGVYKNEKTGYSYHIDKNHVDKKGRPSPHVDVNRPKKSKLPKRKFYL